MKNTKRLIISTILLVFSMNIYGESVAEKAKDKKSENLEYIVFLEVPIQNFASKEQQETFKSTKIEYSNALAFFYEGDYLQSYRGFLEVQNNLEKLYEQLSLDYINRTAEILQNASQQLVDISIKYHKSGRRATRYRKDLDKDREVPELRSYDEKKFHLFYDKKAITDNIDIGFEKLGTAKLIRQKAMSIEDYLEHGKKLTVNMRKLRIEHYTAAISLCREGTLNAIRVFQLLQRNEIYTVQGGVFERKTAEEKATLAKKVQDDTKTDRWQQANKNYHAKERKLDPVFDPRIPEKYKLFANDSMNRIHEEEKCIKLEMKPAKQCNFSEQ